jgi:hypothetical protein
VMVEDARPLRLKSHPIVSFSKAKAPSMSLRGLDGCPA